MPHVEITRRQTHKVYFPTLTHAQEFLNDICRVQKKLSELKETQEWDKSTSIYDYSCVEINDD